MKKILTVFIGFIVLMTLCSCQIISGLTNPGSNISETPDGHKYISDLKLTIGSGLNMLTGYYTGYLIDGIPDGDGTFAGLRDKKVIMQYSGSWEKGQQNGNGKTTWLNGDTYEGQYQNGAIRGSGTWTYNDGTSIKGNFAFGKAYGMASKYDKDGKLIKTGKMIASQFVDDLNTQYQPCDYAALKDNSQQFIGNKVVQIVEVVEKSQSSDNIKLLTNSINYSENEWLIAYHAENSMPNIVAGSKIKIYGRIMGSGSYKKQSGDTVSVPEIFPDFILDAGENVPEVNNPNYSMLCNFPQLYEGLAIHTTGTILSILKQPTCMYVKILMRHVADQPTMAVYNKKGNDSFPDISVNDRITVDGKCGALYTITNNDVTIQARSDETAAKTDVPALSETETSEGTSVDKENTKYYIVQGKTQMIPLITADRIAKLRK